MNYPLVSVIITTFNRPNMLLRSILSVISQTYENIEIVVVDDCSDYDLKEQVASICSNFVYVRNIKNMGVSASRNKGFSESSGEYVSFLDDDDEILPEKIEKQVNLFLSNQDVDAVYCGSLRKYNKSKFERPPLLKGDIFPGVLASCPNAIHTLLLKRWCFDLVGGFDENISFYEDFDFWIRLSRKCLFDYIPDCLVVYNIHGIQSSINGRGSIEGIDLVINKHIDYYQKNKKYYYIQIRRQASKSALIDDYTLFYKYIYSAIIIRPFIIGSYIHLFISIFSRHIHKKLILKYGFREIEGTVTY